MSKAADEITEAQREAAAEWLVRLDGGRRPAAFEAWLQADPRHPLAFQQALALWQALQAPVQQLAAERGAIKTARAERPRPLKAAFAWGGFAWGGFAWAGAACAAVIVGLAIWAAQPMLAGWAQNLSADAVTGYGEKRQLTLPDGSVLHLAGNSAIAIGYDERQRSIRLLRGEVYFDVRRDPARDFIVTAGDEGIVRVIGTRFDVRRGAARFDVAVESGLVEVTAGFAAAPTRLAAGQSLTIENGRVGPVLDADLGRALAWRADRLVVYREPLAQVARELERQQPGRIIIADDSLADLAVSGVFPADDPAGTLTALADTLGLRLVRLTPWLTVIH